MATHSFGPMTIDQAIHIVQVTFPQVYLACHSRHQRKRSTEHALSQRDAAILAHLDATVAVPPSRLAGHLGIARSTLSEALKRLIALGYAKPAGESPRRTDYVMLTARGARAIRDTSVLETQRLRAALRELSARDLQAITTGMERLAAACRAISPPQRGTGVS